MLRKPRSISSEIKSNIETLERVEKRLAEIREKIAKARLPGGLEGKNDDETFWFGFNLGKEEAGLTAEKEYRLMQIQFLKLEERTRNGEETSTQEES